jgi:hypothetical protein
MLAGGTGDTAHESRYTESAMGVFAGLTILVMVKAWFSNLQNLPPVFGPVVVAFHTLRNNSRLMA